MSATNQVFAAFSFIAFVLVLIPLPWHLQAWNTGTCLYMVWTAAGCLIYFVDAVIWNGNVLDSAPVWCDISTRILVGVAVAIPAASLCINRRLYKITSVQSASITLADKRRGVFIDLAIGLGFPMLIMGLQYIVQGHRYDIIEDMGCRTFTYNTPPAYVIVAFPPLVIALISATFSVLTLRSFMTRQSEFKQLMTKNHLITFTRYLRLMALAAVDIVLTVPLAIFVVVVTFKSGTTEPWISWEDTHFGFSRVDQIPASKWRSSPAGSVGLESSRWAVVACGFIMFAFFGFAAEARKNYRNAYVWVASKFGVKFAPTGSTFGSGLGSSILPVYSGCSLPIAVKQEIFRKAETLTTLSDAGSDTDVESMKETQHPAVILLTPPLAETLASPMSATTESYYSEASAPRRTSTDHRSSLPVSVASRSFLEMTTPRPHDSMLSSVSPHDRV